MVFNFTMEWTPRWATLDLKIGLPIQGVHSSSTVNIHVRAQKGYYLEQACTKCMYKRHIAIKQEVDIHEARDKAIEKNI